jgi:hypothetical protein
MKKHCLLLVIAALFLTAIMGCTFEPHVFGIPQSQWNELNPDQRQEVIRGYHRTKSAEIQAASLNAAVAHDYSQQKSHNQANKSQAYILEQQQRDLERQKPKNYAPSSITSGKRSEIAKQDNEKKAVVETTADSMHTSTGYGGTDAR